MPEDRTALTWRPLTTADATAMTALLNAVEAADRTGEHYGEDDVLADLTDPYADLERGSLAAFDGDVMAGYVTATYRPIAEEVHHVFVDGAVRPDHRRHGIGSALLEAGTTAAKQLHALHHPAKTLVIDVQKAEHVAGTAELFRAHGFTPVQFFHEMEHPLGDAIAAAPVPDGLRIEPWSPHTDEDFRRIRNESFTDHPGSSPMPVDAWKNRIVNHTFRPGLSFLVRDVADGTPAGMLVTLCWDADTAATGIREAHFMLIGTVAAYRRRGVASALIGHALRAAAEHGYDRASLGVDTVNPTGALGVYEKAGFVPTIRFVRWALEV